MRRLAVLSLGSVGFTAQVAALEPVSTDGTRTVGITGLGTILTESVACGDHDKGGNPDLNLTNNETDRTGATYLQLILGLGRTCTQLECGASPNDVT